MSTVPGSPSAQSAIKPSADTPGRHASRWRLPTEPYIPSSRRTLVSRLALVLILGMQAALSLSLRNTAFEDEALSGVAR